MRNKSKPMDSAEIDDYVEKLLSGNKRAAARLMTMVENSIDVAAQIVEKIYPHTGNAYIIGVTGLPGSGKSSIINWLIQKYVDMGKKVGVVAVDPTSPFSGGALLGDRIRMKRNFSVRDVFIRSMANRGQLGGLARATNDVVKVLDVAGYDLILIETVGVGQSEVEIFKCAHTTVVLTVPGTGDEIQAIKAGLMEITDIFVVNKMDLTGADRKVANLEAMLDLEENVRVDENRHTVTIARTKGWRPPIQKTNAVSGENIDKLIELIEKHRQYLSENELMDGRLNLKFKSEVLELIKYRMTQHVERLVYKNERIDEFIREIMDKKRDPYIVSEEILLKFIHMGEKD